MTKALVIYHTQFGNTETIAKALASGLSEQGIEVDCTTIDDAPVDKLRDYDFLAVGGPTHGFGMSQPMKAFLKKLEHVDLREKKAFAFDTKFPSRFAGSAAKGIEKRLKNLGLNIATPAASAIVTGGKGPLQAGMDEKFQQIGRELVIK
jgi:flavodoxin